jgi:predicted AlkP superfamily phosphohydrolase/phosphomutase
MVDSLLASVRAKGELLQGIVDEGGLDALVTVFGASHCVGHQCWHLHDAAHPRAGTTPRSEDPVVEVYEAIDREVGRLLERCSDAAVVLNLSHGMRSHTGASQLFDELVARASDALAPPSTLHRGRERAYRGVRYHGNRLLRRVGAGDELYIRPLDASLLAFAVPNNDAHAGIRLNLRGREPRGRVDAADADTVRRDLTAMLLEIRDVDTGTPLIEDVLDVRDVEQGAALDRLPDLLVLWHQGALGERVESPWLGRVERAYRGHRTGDHRPGGVIAVQHASLEPGSSDEAIRTVDIAPLLASLLDAPPAPTWAGTVPKRLLVPTLTS